MAGHQLLCYPFPSYSPKLEQQREYFEAQLTKLRSLGDFETPKSKEPAQRGGWLRRIEQSLLQERLNLMKQKEAADARLQ
jgi:hypothetical protein